jgi:hypothetical protein
MASRSCVVPLTCPSYDQMAAHYRKVGVVVTQL